MYNWFKNWNSNSFKKYFFSFESCIWIIVWQWNNSESPQYCSNIGNSINVSTRNSHWKVLWSYVRDNQSTGQFEDSLLIFLLTSVIELYLFNFIFKTIKIKLGIIKITHIQIHIGMISWNRIIFIFQFIKLLIQG